MGESFPELGERRTVGDPTNLLEKILRQRESLQGGTGFQLPVKLIGDMAQLNHLRHVTTIDACASHVNANARGPPSAARADR